MRSPGALLAGRCPARAATAAASLLLLCCAEREAPAAAQASADPVASDGRIEEAIDGRIEEAIDGRIEEAIDGRIEVAIAGRRFRLEPALDAPSRFRGLSGRDSIADDGGMLFAYPVARQLAMVMRDCAIPIDVAFLDASGRVMALHEMVPEAPRRPDESAAAYDARLRRYGSGAPAMFAVELAGGRLRALGVRVGDRFFFDVPAIRRRVR